MSFVSGFGGRVRIVTFTDELVNPRRAYLAAAVFWRVSQAEADAPPKIDHDLLARMKEMPTASPDRRAVIEAARPLARHSS